MIQLKSHTNPKSNSTIQATENEIREVILPNFFKIGAIDDIDQIWGTSSMVKGIFGLNRWGRMCFSLETKQERSKSRSSAVFKYKFLVGHIDFSSLRVNLITPRSRKIVASYSLNFVGAFDYDPGAVEVRCRGDILFVYSGNANPKSLLFFDLKNKKLLIDKAEDHPKLLIQEYGCMMMNLVNKAVVLLEFENGKKLVAFANEMAKSSNPNISIHKLEKGMPILDEITYADYFQIAIDLQLVSPGRLRLFTSSRIYDIGVDSDGKLTKLGSMKIWQDGMKFYK